MSMDAREIMHEREVSAARIAELERLAAMRLDRIKALGDSLDKADARLVEQCQELARAHEDAAVLSAALHGCLDGGAQRLPPSDEHDADLEAWTTRHPSSGPVVLGPPKKGKACTWRPPADIVVGREDVPRGEQRSGYVAVELKEER